MNITGGRNLSLFEVQEAADIVSSASHEELNMIFGSVINENLDKEIIVTVIATGFSQQSESKNTTIGSVEEDVTYSQFNEQRRQSAPREYRDPSQGYRDQTQYREPSQGYSDQPQYRHTSKGYREQAPQDYHEPTQEYTNTREDYESEREYNRRIRDQDQEQQQKNDETLDTPSFLRKRRFR